MEESVMRKHIDLYVNEYSIDLGRAGKDAIQKVLSVYELANGKMKDNLNEKEIFVGA